MGLLYTCTFGLLGIGCILDAFRLPKLVKEYNEQITAEKERRDREDLENIVSHLDREDALRQQILADQLLREEQDLLFAQSLSLDQERERKEEEEKLIAEQEAKLSQQERDENERKKQEERQRRIELAKKKLEEYPAEPSIEEEAVNLIFRLADGNRLVRRFRKETTLRKLREWLTLQRDAQGLFGNYTISSDFPKRVFTEDDKTVGELFPVSQILSVKEI